MSAVSALRQPLRQSLQYLVSGIFPSSCPVCGGASDELSHSPICGSCWREIRPYNGPACRICGEPLASEHAIHCGTCLAGKRPAFTRVFYYGLYEGALKEAIGICKFHKVRRLARPLAGFMLELGLPAVDAVTAVPLAKKRLLERGFNQGLLLGREISKAIGAPLLPGALRKVKKTGPQAALGRKERLENLRGAFAAGKKCVEGKTILLVDDVITTGATARECSRALLKAGAKEVYVAALARTGLWK
ncbi:MAG: ComF family protein [Nitrospiraceae bacterium]|nr:ComF family protein [Nitrospiraceae bacterium]